MKKRSLFSRTAVLIGLVSALGLLACSEEKKPIKTTASSGQGCVECETQRDTLSSRLKKAQQQIKKLKKQLRARRKPSR